MTRKLTMASDTPPSGGILYVPTANASFTTSSEKHFVALIGSLKVKDSTIVALMIKTIAIISWSGTQC